MDDFHAHLGRLQRYTLFFLSACCLGWAMFADYRPYVAGVILGTAVSLISARYMAWKIDQMSSVILDGVRKRINLGFMTRAALALLAVMVAIKSPHVDIVSTMVSLVFVQFLSLILGFVQSRRK
ncbi:ATP synthase subunit I [Paenibacillus sp. N1-5-1-14]|uniref:ATP synthase subunit I n=1 Tax=Paenibacillus radicibacter TaxID=2972488 RepID=UPI002158BE2E|nr:ATP synthase subunit I [Paenibacillus radicibacter]MCR8645096.1 ATP synthase subunit I [Paenibacillus radicibacter]